VEASGPAITLGDVFDGAGAVAGRAIAPAPPPGQVASLSAPLLAAAASAAGLDWTPPPGLESVRVVRPGGMRATLPAAQSTAGRTLADAAVHRGEAVTVVFQVPGISVRRAGLRALDGGAVGQVIRLQSAERTIEAVVTGAGAARVETP
jgi:flagella basal body P-ring formation protein FlgA